MPRFFLTSNTYDILYLIYSNFGSKNWKQIRKCGKLTNSDKKYVLVTTLIMNVMYNICVYIMHNYFIKYKLCFFFRQYRVWVVGTQNCEWNSFPANRKSMKIIINLNNDYSDKPSRLSRMVGRLKLILFLPTIGATVLKKNHN